MCRSKKPHIHKSSWLLLEIILKSSPLKPILIGLCMCVHVCAHTHTHVLSCVQLFAIPWTVPYQAPLSMEFFKQEYWSRLPFPPPGDLPDPGIEFASPALAGRFFTTGATWEALRGLIKIWCHGFL